ncbi:hypothetical protein GY45DRAFT_725254 [Cubamyces sp. BRFM 1775]|nr:hypothetical protein GY45DRAFT_725254 [Cubamyces sp. BRFM 1775]
MSEHKKAAADVVYHVGASGGCRLTSFVLARPTAVQLPLRLRSSISHIRFSLGLPRLSCIYDNPQCSRSDDYSNSRQAQTAPIWERIGAMLAALAAQARLNPASRPRVACVRQRAHGRVRAQEMEAMHFPLSVTVSSGSARLVQGKHAGKIANDFPDTRPYSSPVHE